MGIFNTLGRKLGLSDDEEELLEEEATESAKKAAPATPEQYAPKEMQNMRDNNDTGFGGRDEAHNNVVDFMSRNPKVQEAVAGFKMKVVIIEPKVFDDAQQVANCLREKRPVVLNFEKTERDVARRILDFISGTIYAIQGAVSRVGNNVFLCAPSNVNVAYTEEEKPKGNADMPWMSSR